MLKLVIGNKNYSSWSMRPWVLLRQTQIGFEEVMVRFDSFAPDSQFKATLGTLSPTGKVPLLIDGALSVWDTLAIGEYIAEQYPDRQLWPAQTAVRARARSICAEMHSGFADLRRLCPMNIEAELAHIGALLWRDHAALRTDVARLDAMWSNLLEHSGGPLLFGDFTVADAYFAPVCTRIKTYALPLSPRALAYVERVLELPGVQAWVGEARAEKDFLDFEEPYRLRP